MKSVYEYISFLNNNIQHYSEINYENIEYSPFKLNNKSQSLYSNITLYNNKEQYRENLKFKTDFMCINDDNLQSDYLTNNKNVSLTFHLTNELQEYISNLEKKIVNDFYNTLSIDLDLNNDTNSICFSDNIPSDIHTLQDTSKTNSNKVEQYKFVSSIKNSKLKCKIGSFEDLFVYDYNFNLIDEPDIIQQNIKNGIYACPNITCMGLWIYKKQFGCTWICSQIQFDKKSIYIPSFLKNDDCEEDY